MSGSKVYIKKPLRRYERAFDEEKVGESDLENSEEVMPPINPDITSPAGLKGPVMNSKKQPVRYKVKLARMKDQDKKNSGDRNTEEQGQ